MKHMCMRGICKIQNDRTCVFFPQNCKTYLDLGKYNLYPYYIKLAGALLASMNSVFGGVRKVWKYPKIKLWSIRRFHKMEKSISSVVIEILGYSQKRPTTLYKTIVWCLFSYCCFNTDQWNFNIKHFIILHINTVSLLPLDAIFLVN